MRFGNSWQEDYWQTFSRDSVGFVGEPIYIPTTFYLPIVRVSCLSQAVRTTWRAAGDIIQIIGDDRNPDCEGQSIAIPLNVRKLVEFSPTVENYSLKFLPKPWIESFELKIESPVWT